MSKQVKSGSSSVSSERSKRSGGGGIFGFGLFHRGRRNKNQKNTDNGGGVLNEVGTTVYAPAPAPPVSSVVRPVEYTTPYVKKNLNQPPVSPLTTTPLTRTRTSPRSTSPTQGDDVDALRNAKPNLLCRTKMFQNACKSAFEVIDIDGSGSIDEKELYSGLLLIHLKLGTYAGPAACRPLSRERCKEFFEKMDYDGSGTLDQTEFNQVMAVLFGNVLIRVVTQWSMTLIIVPLVANLILDGIQTTILSIWEWIANLDEHNAVADRIEVSLENSWQCLVTTTPAPIVHFMTRLHEILSFVPESVWESIPLTFLSTILGLVVVPWILLQIDAIFQAIADRRRPRI